MKLLFAFLLVLVMISAVMHLLSEEILFSSAVTKTDTKSVVVCQYFSFKDFKQRTYAEPGDGTKTPLLDTCKHLRLTGKADVKTLF